MIVVHSILLNRLHGNLRICLTWNICDPNVFHLICYHFRHATFRSHRQAVQRLRYRTTHDSHRSMDLSRRYTVPCSTRQAYIARYRTHVHIPPSLHHMAHQSSFHVPATKVTSLCPDEIAFQAGAVLHPRHLSSPSPFMIILVCVQQLKAALCYP